MLDLQIIRRVLICTAENVNSRVSLLEYQLEALSVIRFHLDISFPSDRYIDPRDVIWFQAADTRSEHDECLIGAHH